MAESAGFPAAFDVYGGADLRVEPDTHQAWVGFVVWWTRCLPVWLVLATVAAASGEFHPLEAFGVLLLLMASIAVLMGTLATLSWGLGPGRISYVVHDGNLMVCRGRKVLKTFPCAGITHLELDDAMTWKALLLRNWQTAPWPSLVIDRNDWPTTRLLVGPKRQRRILLWGNERARRAEADLRRAVTLSGATLTDTGDA